MARQRALAGELRSFLSPLVIGLGIWIGFPSGMAYQDVASMVSGAEGGGHRWNSVIEKAVAGSTHAASMPFVDATPTGSVPLSGAGFRAPGIGSVALMTKARALTDTPDEERVVRSGKQGRIVRVAPVAPPKSFNAGSVLERTSMILRSTIERETEMVFTDPDMSGEEIQIATAFHTRMPEHAAPDLSPQVAELVTSDTFDVLASAYAPQEPDYAKVSPFASLLRDEEAPEAGRFIPPLEKGDHAWVAQPLPAAVFSDAEQTCLATGIYFEARGESVKGQAAVAQVILNRVRAPSYPDTICDVVYQNDHWRNRCQFSFACDGIKDRITSPSHYRTAKEIAMAVTAGRIYLPEVGSSTHYHATYVNPRWNRHMQQMKRIGLHIFYRTYGGGWS